jgi:hypothetical protein
VTVKKKRLSGHEDQERLKLKRLPGYKDWEQLLMKRLPGYQDQEQLMCFAYWKNVRQHSLA